MSLIFKALKKGKSNNGVISTGGGGGGNGAKYGKHKKLSSDMGCGNQMPQRQLLEGLFQAKYLGSTLVDTSFDSHDVAIEAIKTILTMATKAGSSKKLERVQISVNLDGVKVISVATEETLLDISIYRISNCSVDASHSHVCAFIATNDNETNECHAFFCSKRKLAQIITLSIAQTFKIAYDLWLKGQEITTVNSISRKSSLSSAAENNNCNSGQLITVAKVENERRYSATTAAAIGRVRLQQNSHRKCSYSGGSGSDGGSADEDQLLIDMENSRISGSGSGGNNDHEHTTPTTTTTVLNHHSSLSRRRSAGAALVTGGVGIAACPSSRGSRSRDRTGSRGSGVGLGLGLGLASTVIGAQLPISINKNTSLRTRTSSIIDDELPEEFVVTDEDIIVKSKQRTGSMQGWVSFQQDDDDDEGDDDVLEDGTVDGDLIGIGSSRCQQQQQRNVIGSRIRHMSLELCQLSNPRLSLIGHEEVPWQLDNKNKNRQHQQQQLLNPFVI